MRHSRASSRYGCSGDAPRRPCRRAFAHCVSPGMSRREQDQAARPGRARDRVPRAHPSRPEPRQCQQRQQQAREVQGVDAQPPGLQPPRPAGPAQRGSGDRRIDALLDQQRHPAAVGDGLHDAALARATAISRSGRSSDFEHEPHGLGEAGARPVERGLDALPARPGRCGRGAAPATLRAAAPHRARERDRERQRRERRRCRAGGVALRSRRRPIRAGSPRNARTAVPERRPEPRTRRPARADRQRIGHGPSTASAQACRRGGPSSTRPTTLTKQYTARAAVRASAARARAPAIPAPTLCVSARCKSAWSVSHSDTKPFRGAIPAIAPAPTRNAAPDQGMRRRRPPSRSSSQPVRRRARTRRRRGTAAL